MPAHRGRDQHFASLRQPAHPRAQLFRLAAVPAVLEPGVALTRLAARTWRTAVHSASRSAPHSRISASLASGPAVGTAAASIPQLFGPFSHFGDLASASGIVRRVRDEYQRERQLEGIAKAKAAGIYKG